MRKEKQIEEQIEEMANDIWTSCPTPDMNWSEATYTAEKLYNAGYRKCRVGEWLTDRFGLERSICSLCGAVFEGDGGNYCRKCGAKMKEVKMI